MLAKHVVKREDAGSRNGEELRALIATVWIIRNDNSIHGVHDKIVGVVRDDVNGIFSWLIGAHVEIPVITNGEVVTSASNKWTVPAGKVAAATMARPGNDRVD